MNKENNLKIFNQGINPVIAYIISNVLPKYENNKNLKNIISAFKSFFEEINSAETINLVCENAIKTLDYIKNDVLNYITQNNENDIKKGGDTKPQQTAIQKITDLIKIVDNTNKSNVIIQANLQVINSIFSEYFNERVKAIEDIKLDNNIINNISGVNIKPSILPLLVKDLINNFEKYSYIEKKSSIYSIIEWYLSHNRVSGIELYSYYVLNKFIKSDSDINKYFIYDINSYLKIGSDGWFKAHDWFDKR
jgi:hypothetical protein